MVVTQWAFVGPAFAFPHRLGISSTDKELRALAHMWFRLGWALGIKSEFNLCAHDDDVDYVRRYSRAIFEQVVKPAIAEDIPFATELQESMANHLLDGCGHINTLITRGVFRPFMLRLFGVKDGVRLTESELVSWRDRLVFVVAGFFFEVLLRTPLLEVPARAVLNTLMRLNIYSANYLRESITLEHTRPPARRRLTWILYQRLVLPGLSILSFLIHCIKQTFRPSH